MPRLFFVRTQINFRAHEKIFLCAQNFFGGPTEIFRRAHESFSASALRQIFLRIGLRSRPDKAYDVRPPFIVDEA